MITFDIFFHTLKSKNISTYRLIKEKVVSAGHIQRMRENKNITTDTLDKICTYLNCDITDVIDYVSPEEYQQQQIDKKHTKIAELEQTLAELKEPGKSSEN